MHKAFIIFFILNLKLASLHCQTKKQFYLMPSLSVLNGSNSTTAAIHAEGGINFKNFQLGLQSTVDYYLFRTVPITLQCRAFINEHKNKLYVYAGTGYNIAWVTNNQKRITGGGWWGNPNYEYADYKHGFVYNVGIGTILHHKHNRGLTIFGGYSAKTIKEVYRELVFDGVNTTQIPRSNTFYLGRINISIGYCL